MQARDIPCIKKFVNEFETTCYLIRFKLNRYINKRQDLTIVSKQFVQLTPKAISIETPKTEKPITPKVIPENKPNDINTDINASIILVEEPEEYVIV